MADGSVNLAKAIYTALIGDSVVSGLVGTRVFDVPPHGHETFPYITLADHSAREWGGDDFSGREHSVDLLVFSRPEMPDTKELRQIISAVSEALHTAELSVTGQDLVTLRYQSHTTIRDGDGQTFMGVVTFRAVTCPT